MMNFNSRIFIFSDTVIVPIIDNALSESNIIKQYDHTEILSLYDTVISYSLERIFRDLIGLNVKCNYVDENNMLINTTHKIDELFNNTIFGRFIYKEIEDLIINEIYAPPATLPNFIDDRTYTVKAKFTPSSITCTVKPIKE